MLFALIAGAGTAITPCVLPVLPALLSASALGGRRRPLGIVLGLAVTFTIAIVALTQLVNGVGLGKSTTRTLAIIVLIGFGVVLMVPSLSQRVQAPLSRLARFGPKTRGDGFISGLGVGAALGFVCAPCAGPILGAVIGVSASPGGPSVRAVVIAVTYSVGLSAVLLAYGFGGRAVLTRIRKVARGHVVETVLGLVLAATGFAMAFNLDVRFENALAKSFPSFDPTNGLEQSAAVQNRLAALRPASRFKTAADTLPDKGQAPDFTDTQRWFNSPPLSLKRLRGKVVLVDFWTYTCINCIRTLPFVKGLYHQYHRYGLEVVGVETPEFTFEQNAANVAQAIKSDGIEYPVVQDNRYGTWNAYQNEAWPAEYLIDADGEVRHTQFGEGDYSQSEDAVRTLLRAAGAKHLPPRMTAHAVMASSQLGTPETYLDPQRAQGFVDPPKPGTHYYHAPNGQIGLNQWELEGSFAANSQGITPTGARGYVAGGVQAQNAYLVMTARGTQRARVLVNGKPGVERGSDVDSRGYVTVKGQRLYNLVKLRGDQRFSLTVELPHGITAYDFTFG
ncbi:MAG: redoxin domain-containing protein [Solirubrobacterales bacterium]|nr:redoxin domain-containing protein [Solirubrobacterales bacterium]